MFCNIAKSQANLNIININFLIKIQHSISLYGAPYGLSLNFAKMPSKKGVPKKVLQKKQKSVPKKAKMPLSSEATLNMSEVA